MRYLVALFVLIFSASGPVHAEWPHTEWMILEDYDHYDPTRRVTEPVGWRKRIAEKYIISLQRSSLWFQSMSFRAPLQVTETIDNKTLYVAFLNWKTSDRGSSHTENGYTQLSTYPGFMTPKDSIDELFQASAVHELFHGIQFAHPAYHSYAESLPPGPPECNPGEKGGQWLSEGSASAVQIQYLEHTLGQEYGHAFKGSPRITWVRYFDQPLDWGRLPPEHRNPIATWAQNVSWQCSYGTWYFWYAVGNMLGSKDVHDMRRTAYLRYIFEQEGDWSGTGLAMVDAGLKRAARALDAPNSYRGGLFALYPQFVAQYLDEDSFYEKVETVAMATPSLYETTSLHSGPIQPVATRAWRFRIQLPPEATPVPYTVRFVLEAPNQANLDGLHLIVNNRVVARPENSHVPYSHTRRTDQDMINNQGEIEYFVRIANVAQDAASTESADFTLRVEVDGFYGDSAQPSINPIVGDLPPGFEITGPDPRWTCAGGDDGRAVFTIMTPDGHADQLERILPQALKNIDSDLNRAEMQAREHSQEELEHIRHERGKFETTMQAMLQKSGATENIAQAADESRRTNETTILVKLYGTNASGPCDVLFSATLPGRQPTAQSMTGDHFSVMINTESSNNALAAISSLGATLDFAEMLTMTEEQLERQGQKFKHSVQNIVTDFDVPDGGWTQCSDNDHECDIGKLSLERASHDHLSGNFNFRLYRGDLQLVHGSEIENPREYADVTGFMNITSAQTQNNNSLIDFMSRGARPGELFYMPGIENLLQGGSLFGE